MARISWYVNEFTDGHGVNVTLGRHSVRRLAPPDPNGPEKGIDGETDARGVIAFCRALQGWLTVHARYHPGFHKAYKAKDPGGEPTQPHGRLWGVQLQALPDQPYLWCPETAGTREMAEQWADDYGAATGAVVVFRNLGPIREYSPAAAGQPT